MNVMHLLHRALVVAGGGQWRRSHGRDITHTNLVGWLFGFVVCVWVLNAKEASSDEAG